MCSARVETQLGLASTRGPRGCFRNQAPIRAGVPRVGVAVDALSGLVTVDSQLDDVLRGLEGVGYRAGRQVPSVRQLPTGVPELLADALAQAEVAWRAAQRAVDRTRPLVESARRSVGDVGADLGSSPQRVRADLGVLSDQVALALEVAGEALRHLDVADRRLDTVRSGLVASVGEDQPAWVREVAGKTRELGQVVSQDRDGLTPVRARLRDASRNAGDVGADPPSQVAVLGVNGSAERRLRAEQRMPPGAVGPAAGGPRR